jgi:hypothetical protein
MLKGIRRVDTETGRDGRYTKVRLVFGPHYFLELHADASDQVTFILGATHHGFRAEATEVSGELEQVINEIREHHPAKVVD